MEKELPMPKKEGEAYQFQAFPAWCKGPNGESDVFEAEGDVPDGWTLPDGTTKGGKAKAPATATPPASPASAASTDETEVDADGWPWSADLHAATKTKTSAGLWRMRVGVTRPAPKTTAPLDL
jgi:hypothetical protein